jgi:hypothetical protein
MCANTHTARVFLTVGNRLIAQIAGVTPRQIRSSRTVSCAQLELFLSADYAECADGENTAAPSRFSN